MIDRLPTELLSVLRKYLDDDDLFHLAQTNHRLRTIIKSSDELWKVSLLNKWYRPDLLPSRLPKHSYYDEYVNCTRKDNIIRRVVEEVAEKCPASDTPEMKMLLEELSSYSFKAFYILDKLQKHLGPERSCVVKTSGLDCEAYTAEEMAKWLNSRIEQLAVVWVARCCLERLRLEYLCNSLMDAAEMNTYQVATEGEAAAAMLDLCLVDPNFFELNRIRLRVLDKTVVRLKKQSFDNLRDKTNGMWVCLRESIRSEVQFSFDGRFENTESMLVFESYLLLRFYSGDDPGTGMVWAMAMYELCCRLNMTGYVCYSNLLICEAGESVLMTYNADGISIIDYRGPDERESDERESRAISKFFRSGPTRRQIFETILHDTPHAQRSQGRVNVRSFSGTPYMQITPPPAQEFIRSQNCLCANYSIHEANVVNVFRCFAEYLLYKSSRPQYSLESANIFFFNKSRTSVVETEFFLRFRESMIKDVIAKRKTLYADLLTLLRERYPSAHRFEMFGLRMGTFDHVVTTLEPGRIFQHVRTGLLVVVLYSELIHEDDGEAVTAVTCYTDKGTIMRIRECNLEPIFKPEFRQLYQFAEFDEIGEYFKGYDSQNMKFIPNAALEHLTSSAAQKAGEDTCVNVT